MLNHSSIQKRRYGFDSNSECQDENVYFIELSSVETAVTSSASKVGTQLKHRRFNLSRILKGNTSILLCLILFYYSSCTKFVDVGAPVTSSNTENVYTNDATAASVLTGIYTTLSNQNLTGSSGLTSVSVITGLSSDELTLVVNNPGLLPYYNNTLTSNSVTIWSSVYSITFSANSAIEGLNKSESLTPDVKKQLLGEAMFIRALCYFYLVNLYGDVPLALTTDYKINSILPREKSEIVYNQIISDLKDAGSMLSATYLDGAARTETSERVRPTKSAAAALLSRSYLYIKDYSKAETEASSIISKTALYDTVPINEVFRSNNKEAIWQLQTVGIDANSNTKEGQFFIPLSNTINSVSTYLSQNLISSFEPGDRRRSDWININMINGIPYYYPFKYKIGRISEVPLEYSTVLRLGEQFLIRAEARANLGNLIGAVNDVNIVRHRAGLGDIGVASKTEILETIFHERQVELFTEYGHRWLDLKRANRADWILAPIKGSNWQSTDQLYPLPQVDIDRDINLKGQQNPGYD